jgi:hypothetical protein
MVVVKAIFTVPSYGIEYECYGGNDNADRGDAYKGATTDALTKIGSWLGIGADVFKGLHDKTAKPMTTAQQPKPRKAVTAIELDNEKTCNALLSWAYAAKNAHPDKPFVASEYLAQHYDVSEHNRKRFDALFSSYLSAISNQK